MRNTICLLFSATCAFAQLAGLPQHGVTLEGTPDVPIVVNKSPHRILAYTLLLSRGGGGPATPAITAFLGELRQRQPTIGIAPGTSRPHVSLTQTATSTGVPTSSGFTGALLDSVLFDTGSLVGPDATNMFDVIRARIQGERDVHQLLLAQRNTSTVSAWLSIGAMARGQTPDLPPALSEDYKRSYVFAVTAFSKEMEAVRGKQGDAAAFRLAESSAFYPAITRGGK